MISEDTLNTVLECIKKHSQTNTFRLARELNIDRYKILNTIKKLEERQLVEFKSGKVKFLKKIEIKKAHSKPKNEVGVKAKKAIDELIILENLQDENKRLRERIKELQLKSNTQPKIIRKIVIKKVPIEKIEATPKKFNLPKFIVTHISFLKTFVASYISEFTRRCQRLWPMSIHSPRKSPNEMRRCQRLCLCAHRKTFLAQYNIRWIKNIQQLAKAKFIKQKVNIDVPKINFAELNKNIQQLNIPKILELK